MQTEREETAFLTLLTYPLAYRLLWPHVHSSHHYLLHA